MDKAKIPSKILDYDNDQLRTHIEKDLFKKYRQQIPLPLPHSALRPLLRTFTPLYLPSPPLSLHNTAIPPDQLSSAIPDQGPRVLAVNEDPGSQQ
ncbi:hypothetical protein PCANC_18266 [Puccinia coronata f. sp. avenae]|uniref:Uncharacterized protein n=1 Tax=Puccinia coronata f. sp. avenae TaxID=200324 RepID=A0A2N5UFV9_9BASI|nr:hypothetical protein PCANC_18266 [Puccinia coronata f. sp. avenae]